MCSNAARFLVAVSLPAAAWCQQNSTGLSARTLYYQGEPEKDSLPLAPKTQSSTETKAAHSKSSIPRTRTDRTGGGTVNVASTVTPKVVPAVQHLGLRYDVLRVSQVSGKSEPVSADQMFAPGECLQLEFAPNRSGYLYVFEQGSSGRWQVLLPSALMPDETNIIRSRTSFRVPSRHCFKLESPAGNERLFVVLSRNVEDVYELDRAIRKKPIASSDLEEAPPPAQVLMTQNDLNRAIDRMRADLSSRDISIEKLDRSEGPDEPPSSVYVVNASNTPSDRLVTEILIRHQ